MSGRVADEVVLNDEERAFLVARVRRHKVARSLSDRCRMILLCAEGLQGKEVGARLGVHEHTVGKWRRRFVKDRIAGLADAFRPGRPRAVSDTQVAEVIERTLTGTPKDAPPHWSTRSMAAATGLSHTTIRRIWNVFGLQPHRSETFKLSTDPLLVDKVHAIVGLYRAPPSRAIVLCVDENSQIQALDREQPVLEMAPGVAERRTHTSIRHGTTSLFAALDIATGAVIGKGCKRHRATEFLDFLKKIDFAMPDGPDVHVLMDNHATHKTSKIKAWLARRPHWHVHFTPTSASWINQVERWFAELTRKQLQGGVHRRTGRRHRRLHQDAQRKSQTLPMAPPAASTRVGILVVKPPRKRPMQRDRISFPDRSRHADGPGWKTRRSSRCHHHKPPRLRPKDDPTRRPCLRHIFDRVCNENAIKHRLTRPYHPWTNGQVEPMNRTIKKATVKRDHYGSHNQLRSHLADFIGACNHPRRLKTLRGLTPFKVITKRWTQHPERFKINPAHHTTKPIN